jgi:hypothetical protein
LRSSSATDIVAWYIAGSSTIFTLVSLSHSEPVG